MKHRGQPTLQLQEVVQQWGAHALGLQAVGAFNGRTMHKSPWVRRWTVRQPLRVLKRSMGGSKAPRDG